MYSISCHSGPRYNGTRLYLGDASPSPINQTKRIIIAILTRWDYPIDLCIILNKKTSKLRFTGLCEGNPLVTGGFPTQRASNAEMFPFDDVIMIYVIQTQPTRAISTMTGFRSADLCTWRSVIMFCINWDLLVSFSQLLIKTYCYHSVVHTFIFINGWRQSLSYHEI